MWERGRWESDGWAAPEDTIAFWRVADDTMELGKDADTVVFRRCGELRSPVGRPATLARAGGAMAVATLASRLTGFLRAIVFVWVVGAGVAADAYNVANTLPNQVYELLIGGVLTSVMVPVLVRAHARDPDGGRLYTQRLLTVTSVTLLAVTALAMAAAPLLTSLVVGDSTGAADPALATVFAVLLLPQILCYGLAALFTAILNAQRRFAPGAWSPVLNNVILLATFILYRLIPGQLTIHSSITDPHVLVLGIGSTVGVAAQAAVLVPYVLRTGVRPRWRWGWDRRMAEFGRLAFWTVGYGVVGQAGVVVVSKVATAYVGLTVYQLVWLLIQMPYGVIGYSLITAILPRMSAAADRGRFADVVDDLSMATRSCVVTMLPISVLLTVLGPAVGTALFAVGQGRGQAASFGIALAWGAFGLLPYSVTLLQLRAFYAMHDARTPVAIMVVVVMVKIGLTVGAPIVLAPDRVVYGLTFANSLSFVLGWLVGDLWLRRRLGPLGARRLLRTLVKTLLASVTGALASVIVGALAHHVVTGSVDGAWFTVVAGGLVGAAVTVATMVLLRVDELRPITQRILRG